MADEDFEDVDGRETTREDATPEGHFREEATDVVIQPGETLSAIAARYGTTVEALTELNGIDNPDLIYAGATIKLPASAGETEAAGAAADTSDRVDTGAESPQAEPSLASASLDRFELDQTAPADALRAQVRVARAQALQQESERPDADSATVERLQGRLDWLSGKLGGAAVAVEAAPAEPADRQAAPTEAQQDSQAAPPEVQGLQAAAADNPDLRNAADADQDLRTRGPEGQNLGADAGRLESLATDIAGAEAGLGAAGGLPDDLGLGDPELPGLGAGLGATAGLPGDLGVGGADVPGIDIPGVGGGPGADAGTGISGSGFPGIGTDLGVTLGQQSSTGGARVGGGGGRELDRTGDPGADAGGGGSSFTGGGSTGGGRQDAPDARPDTGTGGGGLTIALLRDLEIGSTAASFVTAYLGQRSHGCQRAGVGEGVGGSGTGFPSSSVHVVCPRKVTQVMFPGVAVGAAVEAGGGVGVGGSTQV